MARFITKLDPGRFILPKTPQTYYNYSIQLPEPEDNFHTHDCPPLPNSLMQNTYTDACLRVLGSVGSSPRITVPAKPGMLRLMRVCRLLKLAKHHQGKICMTWKFDNRQVPSPCAELRVWIRCHPRFQSSIWGLLAQPLQFSFLIPLDEGMMVCRGLGVQF